MLHLHDRTTAPTRTIVVDRLDRLPGGRAVATLTADDQIVLAFTGVDISEAGSVGLQDALQRLLDDGIIQICQNPAPAESQQHQAS